MKKNLFKAAACVAALAASSAFAQKAGDNIVGLGLASINPDAKLGGLSSSGPFAVPFSAVTAGASGDVSSEITGSLSWLHMYSNAIGIEATIGLPPKHTIDLRTPSPFASAAFHPAAATLKPYTPAVVAKYFFSQPGATVRPYLGLGLSWVTFHGFNVNKADPMVAQVAGTSASASSDWTPVYNAGVIYNINDRWSVNASVAYLPIRTTVTFVGAGGTVTRGDLKLNTTDYVVRLGYRF
ncbi:OmpW/AlkL family protein [Ramlibacter sp. MAHUQ-53]|uniref:OmpW/AlkL family protein n=1 Tax=unclassified Ramlibacter TaxID=2617605 RepID=UPI0036311893